MPTFSNTPPDPDSQRAMPIRRTPTQGRLNAAVTVNDLVGCYTHFYQGHTVPCEAPDCDPCNNGIPYRWHGYVAAIQAATRLHFILEFTAQVADSFRDYFKLNRTLRGCIISAERMHHRPNGRVIITLKPGDLAQLNLPEPPDLIACLCIIWHLPPISAEQIRDEHGKRIISIDRDARIVADAMSGQRKNGRPK